MITLDAIMAEVKLAGLPCELQGGSKHIKIVVCGEMCGIWPRVANSNQRAAKNIRAQVRRCVKKHIEVVDTLRRTM